MIEHIALGNSPEERKRKLYSLIRTGEITLGGYKKNKGYGLLSCKAGKRMKPENQVFFRDEQDAVDNGYRPCGACLRSKYMLWKAGLPFDINITTHITTKKRKSTIAT